MKHPVAIYQMGRVGSTSLYRALLRSGYTANKDCFHLHELRKEKIPPRNGGEKRFLSLLEQNQIGEDWRIISITRDIVPRNVSNFFYCMELDFHEWKIDGNPREMTISQLKECFYRSYVWKHTWAQNWFDNQLKRFFELDVYESPFPTEVGWKILDNLLVIRMENLHQSQEVISSFLGIDDFKLARENASSGQWYSSLYQSFLSSGLRDDYVDAMYNCRYMNHFYSPEEIKAFRARWVKQLLPISIL